MALNIIKTINPFLHHVGTGSGFEWWPQVVMTNRMRSICEEPSFLGIILAVFIPFIISKLAENNKFYIKCMVCINILFLSAIIAVAQSKTAMVVCIADFVLLVWVLRKQLKTILLFLFVSAIGFAVGLQGINNIDSYRASLKNKDIDTEININQYMSDNLAGAVNVDKGSNTARYSNMYAHLKVGLEHPIFGVGYDLAKGYAIKNIPEWGKKSGEVRMWIKRQQEWGVARIGMPNVNNYAKIFAESGILGLIIFLLPVFYLFYKLYINRSLLNVNEKYYLSIGCTLIALCSLLVSMLSAKNFLSFYILTAMLLCGINELECNKNKQKPST